MTSTKIKLGYDPNTTLVKWFNEDCLLYYIRNRKIDFNKLHKEIDKDIIIKFDSKLRIQEEHNKTYLNIVYSIKRKIILDNSKRDYLYTLFYKVSYSD